MAFFAVQKCLKPVQGAVRGQPERIQKRAVKAAVYTDSHWEYRIKKVVGIYLILLLYCFTIDFMEYGEIQNETGRRLYAETYFSGR